VKIATVGTGMIGGTLARRFAAAGHHVYLSHRRGAQSLLALASEIGPNAEAATPGEAAAMAEVVVIAVPLRAVADLPAAQLAGKVVIDPTNYYPRRDGQIPELDRGIRTSSERNARLLPGARLVKAFNTTYFEHLIGAGQPAGSTGRKAVPIAGDDMHAKEVVAALADTIGFDVVDVGALSAGRKLEPAWPVFNQLLTRAQTEAMLRD
jgi:predicted dinucleotide-binding enzyme